MESVISAIVQSVGGIGSLVVLVILWRAGLLSGNNSSGTLEPKMDQLIENYNHNVTDRDNKILDGQERMQKVLEDMLKEQRAHNELDNEVLREIKNMKEYGLPCRDKKP